MIWLGNIGCARSIWKRKQGKIRPLTAIMVRQKQIERDIPREISAVQHRNFRYRKSISSFFNPKQGSSRD